MELKDLVNELYTYYNSNNTTDNIFVLDKLESLYKVIKLNENRIIESLIFDMNVSKINVENELKFFYYEINKYIKRYHKIKKSINNKIRYFKNSLKTNYKPYGLVMLVNNYSLPIINLLVPLIGIIASGNVCIIKLSTKHQTYNLLIKEILETIFLKEYILVIDQNDFSYKEIMKVNYDFLYFSGKIINFDFYYRKNIKYIRNIDNKTITIIDKDIDIDYTINKIIKTKFLYNGQTNFAPDILLIARYNYTQILNKIKHYINVFTDKDNTKIIDKINFVRLTSYLNDGKIVVGGEFNSKELKIDFTVMKDILDKSKMLTEEIYGPILPVIIYENFEDALKITKKLSNSKYFYIFSNNKNNINLLQQDNFFNDINIYINDIPFLDINFNNLFNGLDNKIDGFNKDFNLYYMFSKYNNIFMVKK